MNLPSPLAGEGRVRGNFAAILAGWNYDEITAKSIVARCVMGMRVLVVDDSGFMRKRIVEELKAQGHSVVGEAKGGIEAVEMYRTLRPDLVTMDITMRDKDGITAAKEILSEDPDAKILFLTILNDEKYKTEAEKLGAKGFINKTDHLSIAQVIHDMELNR